ncbi:MAG: cytochrome c [bacterium]|nr:MAG: cytochrome c [bacterium]
MKTILRIGLLAGAVIFAAAYEGTAYADEVQLQTPEYQLNKETIVRGGIFFAQNCLACHSMKYIRYNRLATDLGLDKKFITRNFMMPKGAEYLRGMITAMPPKLAAKWLGATPPDLTLAARYRGTDWIYTYLRSFYWDPDKPTGWNNHVFPDVAMPNVLFSYSGTVDDKGQVIKKASYSSQEYDQKTTDLIAWMRYTSDPSIIVRRQIAPYVIGFLVIFTILAYLLKRAYWRDVH